MSMNVKDSNRFDSTFVRDFNKKKNAFLKIGLIKQERKKKNLSFLLLNLCM